MSGLEDSFCVEVLYRRYLADRHAFDDPIATGVQQERIVVGAELLREIRSKYDVDHIEATGASPGLVVQVHGMRPAQDASFADLGVDTYFELRVSEINGRPVEFDDIGVVAGAMGLLYPPKEIAWDHEMMAGL